MSAQLSAIASSSAPSTEKVSSYTSLLDEICNNAGSASLQASLGQFIDALAGQESSASLVICKQVIAVFVKRLQDVGSVEVKQAIADKTLELLSQRQASFEEQVWHWLHV